MHAVHGLVLTAVSFYNVHVRSSLQSSPIELTVQRHALSTFGLYGWFDCLELLWYSLVALTLSQKHLFYFPNTISTATNVCSA